MMTWQQYQWIVLAWMAAGLGTFLYLLRVNAPFGRHIRSGWGPTVDNRLAWIVMECTVLLSLTLSWAAGPKPATLPLAVVAGLFYAHYLHRSLIFPWFLRTSGKRMPLAVMLSAVGFNVVNGFLLGYFFSHFANYPPGWLQDSRFWFGLGLFVLGAGINIFSDYHLIRLRRPGETGYKLPVGGWFRFVSCPNHFGEILEWMGFAILSWCLPGAAFAFWTFANLAPRAWAHHRWYLERFEAYPAGRKALLPFIW